MDINKYRTFQKIKELIVYCGGYSCEKKSNCCTIVKKNGHKNVKVYSAGEPEWAKKVIWSGTNVIKSYQENNSALLVDARPAVKFFQKQFLEVFQFWIQILIN